MRRITALQNVRIYESDGLTDVTETDFAAILTNPPIRAGKETIFRFYDRCLFEIACGWRIVGCHSEETRCSINYSIN